MRFLWLALLGFLTSCATVNPTVLPPLQDPILAGPADADVLHRLYAYGDTRTGAFLFENQLNQGEGVHDWVVQEMLRNGQSRRPDAVLFMGDAVYAGGASFHYDNFANVIKRFTDAGVFFVPAIGNHELLAGIVGVISPWWDKQDPSSDDAGEEIFKKHILDKHQFDPRIDPTPGRQLPTPEKVNADAQTIQDRILPRLEEKTVGGYPPMGKVLRGAKVMNEIYVKRVGLKYLAPVFDGLHQGQNETRTWYTVGASGKPSVTVIVLDTNCLDYQDQFDWFKKQMDTDQSDFMIVIGHHPPDTINGWDRYMPYLTSRKAVLWLFSHVHAFEYGFLDGEQPNSLSRAEFITGGGGAPPDANSEQSYPIKGWTSGPPGLVAGRMFHYLDIKITKDKIYVTVVGCTRKGEPMVPKATYVIGIPR